MPSCMSWNGTTGISPVPAYYDANFNFVQTLGELVLRSGLTLGLPLVPGENNTLLYWNSLGRDIYRIHPDLTVTREWEITFGADRNFPSLEEVDEYDLLDWIRRPEWMSKHAGMIGNVWEWQGNLIFLYKDGEQSCIAIINEKKGHMAPLRIADEDDYVILCYTFDNGKLYIITEEQSGEIVRIVNLKLPPEINIPSFPESGKQRHGHPRCPHSPSGEASFIIPTSVKCSCPLSYAAAPSARRKHRLLSRFADL